MGFSPCQAQLFVYGLQLALQSVDRNRGAIPYRTVEAISETSDGEELAAEPDDEDEDNNDDDDEEDSDESDGEDDDDSDSENSDEESNDDEESEDGDEDDDPDNETTEELVADAKYLKSISNALDVGDMRLAERLLKE